VLRKVRILTLPPERGSVTRSTHALSSALRLSEPRSVRLPFVLVVVPRSAPLSKVRVEFRL